MKFIIFVNFIFSDVTIESHSVSELWFFLNLSLIIYFKINLSQRFYTEDFYPPFYTKRSHEAKSYRIILPSKSHHHSVSYMKKIVLIEWNIFSKIRPHVFIIIADE